MSTAPELENAARTLQNDLLSATTGGPVRIASFPRTWLALSLWTLFAWARNPRTWLLVAGAAVLAILFPVAAWITLALVVGYFPVMALVSAYITFSGSWNLLIDEQRTAVIGLRTWHHDGAVQLILDSHLARRVGSGQGRRLRETLAPDLAKTMAHHPGTVVRFRAGNPRLAAVYGAELRAALPETDGWSHHLDGVNGTVRPSLPLARNARQATTAGGGSPR
ncbi:hypothetical protein LWF15_33150 [Kineosporia rhizophila]|uniref:hypothetical protein n=1 Tax=Kineosporia rhizophila TaxID=84633 RepID=UPI001E480724|nr:hypothetical protein [Kineosporia rhizophila]MCE0540352.1 hypothetical protein [Kineosporia rhizophila]